MRVKKTMSQLQSGFEVMRTHPATIIRPASTFALVALLAIGCNGLPGNEAVTQNSPQTYMAPVVAGPVTGGVIPVAPGVLVYNSASGQLATYTIDDHLDTFSQSTTSFVSTQQGTEVNNAGGFTTLARGLRSLGTTFASPYGGSNTVPSSNYSPALVGSYAVELAGQSGGLVQLLGQAATPLVATPSCPSFATPQTFQFITLPAAVIGSGTAATTWNPASETAYGSVSIATSGSTVNLTKIQQFTLPVGGGTPGAPANSFQPTATGVCAPTPYGNTISLPGVAFLSEPGGNQTVEPTAILGISPSGLLVESNGNIPGITVSNGVYYDNVLGAGTGAIGLPQPSKPLGSTPVSGPQYLGFIYGTGNSASSPTGWSSTAASFGFAATPESCSSIVPSTVTLINPIYGGDFPANDPSSAAVQANGGYGNCNFAVDLGPESANGLYSAATVWIAPAFSANTSGQTISFPAVAIAGQLNGKFVILLIGHDTTSIPQQAWSLYLMQSN
jgi:hypothetical protein